MCSSAAHFCTSGLKCVFQFNKQVILHSKPFSHSLLKYSPTCKYCSSPGMTAIVDKLLNENPLMRVKDKEKVESLLSLAIAGGKEKLQLVIDFDHTLTKTKDENGQPLDCSWGVMENSPLLPVSYTSECNALRSKYLPIELDPKMSVEEKIPFIVEWYSEANRILQKSRVKKEFFPEMVAAANLEFRTETNAMFDYLANIKVPILILSAGLGDVIQEIIRQKGLDQENVKVASNFLAFDSDGFVSGLASDIIHVFNKNENSVQDPEYFNVIQSRNNVILLGDSPGDLTMADGLKNPGQIIKIGFLNSNIDALLERYLNMFDIVLIDDQTMSVPYEIVKLVCP